MGSELQRERLHSNESMPNMKTSGDFAYAMGIYAWVEYFIGSDKGKMVRKLLEDKIGYFLYNI